MNFNYKTKDKVVNYSYNEGMARYMSLVYSNMAKALCVSGLVAFLVSLSPSIMKMIFGTPLSFVVMFAPLVVVLLFSFKVHKMPYSDALTVFYIYAALVGLSISFIFLAYTGTSILRVFFITAATFGGMSLYGHNTKKDLTSFGSFLIMGLWGVIIASLVNIFLKSSGLQFAISLISVFVFIGLTAYDTQRIKQMYYSCDGMDLDSAKKVALMGSLSLYMDFINLFISLLRFFGERKD